MDQTISVYGTRGFACFIEFNPLKVRPVKLPRGAVFVISNSFFTAEKAVLAARGYNLRVVEGRVAAKLIAKAMKLPGYLEYKSLRDLQRDLNRDLAGMQELARKVLHEGSYSTSEIESILGVSMTQETLFPDRPAIAKVLEVNDAFKCLDRALHVYGEAERVERFLETCEKGEEDALERLGALMNASHASCDQLYECSCEALNELVVLGRWASGGRWSVGSMARWAVG